MTNPANDPSTDPVGTVRIHPGHDRNDPRANRLIKSNLGGLPWKHFTGPDNSLMRGESSNEDVASAPVQPLDEVARVLRHPERPKDDARYVFEPGAFIRAVDEARFVVLVPGNIHGPFTTFKQAERWVRTNIDMDDERHEWAIRALADVDLALVPVEDTDTPEPDPAPVLGPVEPCMLAECWNPASSVTPSTCREHAEPSTVDTSARERIAQAFSDWAADAVLAALPELAEHAKLRGRADSWRKTAERHKSDLALALAELQQWRTGARITKNSSDSLDRVIDLEEENADLRAKLEALYEELLETRSDRDNAEHRANKAALQADT